MYIGPCQTSMMELFLRECLVLFYDLFQAQEKPDTIFDLSVIGIKQVFDCRIFYGVLILL